MARRADDKIISCSASEPRPRGSTHVRTFQMGQHPPQESGGGFQERQDLHAADQGGHGGRAPGRGRSGDEPAAAPCDRQGIRREHAQGHDRARGEARRGRPGRRHVRGDTLRGLRAGRRRGDGGLHDRQPHPHRGGGAPRVRETRRQSRHRRLGGVPVQALRAVRVRARDERGKSDGSCARCRRRGRRQERRRLGGSDQRARRFHRGE